MNASTAVEPNRTIGRSISWSARFVGFGLRSLARIAPRAAADQAAALFLTPRRGRPPAHETEWLRAAHRDEVRIGRRAIATWTWEGATWRSPTVLLVHGWGGRGAQLGAFVAPLRAEGMRVVAFDAPAHGRSSGRRTNLVQFAETVGEMLERSSEWATPRGVVAHSFGAAATTIALARGARAERVVLVAPAEDYSHFTGVFRAALGLDAATVERMQRRIERRVGAVWSDLRGSVLAPRLSQPLLVVHDEKDRDVPLAHGETYAARWPEARLLRTTGLGHHRVLRDADVVAEAVRHLAD